MSTVAGPVPSLVLLFKELDTRWPRRDRRTDGSTRKKVPGARASDHHPDSLGRVHAIDIDKDGIDADLVTRILCDNRLPTRYVIWNRHIYERKHKWAKRKYTGTSNPHTDHIHVSIERADWARNFRAGWGIAGGKGGFGAAPGQVDTTLDTDWNFRPQVQSTAGWLENLGDSTRGYSLGIKGLRN